MAEAVIVAAARTPIGKVGRGTLADVRSDDLGGFAVDRALDQVPALDPAEVTDLYWGCALTYHSQGYNIARQVGLLSRLPDGVPATTMTRACASSLTALRAAVHAVWADDGSAYVVGGSDSYSMVMGRGFDPDDHNPRFTDPARSDYAGPAYIDVFDTAEIVADRYGVTRSEMDAFALESHRRAIAARDSGFWEHEISPYVKADGTVVSDDDCPRANTSLEALAALTPVLADWSGLGGSAENADGGGSADGDGAFGTRGRGEGRGGHGVDERDRQCSPARGEPGGWRGHGPESQPNDSVRPGQHATGDGSGRNGGVGDPASRRDQGGRVGTAWVAGGRVDPARVAGDPVSRDDEAGVVGDPAGRGDEGGRVDAARVDAARVAGGRVTAGNTTVAGDGAAALVVMSARRAAELGLTPLARVTATAVSGLAPEVMGMGPVEATRRALARAGQGIGDVDVVECHENFAAQVIPVCRELGIDVERQLNPFGGSLALGHPSGMTGARIVVTLLNALRALDGTLGLATTCAAGGQGLTVVLERLA